MLNKMETMKSILSIIGVLIFLIFITCFVYLPNRQILLSSFALQKQNDFYIENLSESISLKDAIPVPDSIGLQYNPYQFKIVNNSNSEIVYQIVFHKSSSEIGAQEIDILSNRYLKFSLKSLDNTLVEPTILPDDGILYNASLAAHSQLVFEFRMWLDWDADNNAMDKVFVGKIEINSIAS